jgi:hypothetical protein
MDPQTLSTIGIVLEGLSVIILGYEAFYGYYKRIERMGRTFKQTRIEEQWKMAISWILLAIGLLLQIAGLYNITI